MNKEVEKILDNFLILEKRGVPLDTKAVVTGEKHNLLKELSSLIAKEKREAVDEFEKSLLPKTDKILELMPIKAKQIRKEAVEGFVEYWFEKFGETGAKDEEPFAFGMALGSVRRGAEQYLKEIE